MPLIRWWYDFACILTMKPLELPPVLGQALQILQLRDWHRRLQWALWGHPWQRLDLVLLAGGGHHPQGWHGPTEGGSGASCLPTPWRCRRDSFFWAERGKLFNFLESSSSWYKRLGDLSQVVASWSIESLGPSWDGAENIELCSRCMCRRRSLHCQMGQDNSRKTSQHCLRCSLLSLWLVANFEPQHDFLSNLLQDGNTDISIQISQVFLSRNTRSKVSKTNFMGKPLLNSSEQSRSGGWIVALVEL